MDRARRVFTVEAETGEDTRMAGGAAGAAAAAAKAYDRASWATAAFLGGIAQHLLDTTLGYVKQREQFGRPVGSFQAVKHKLAETLLVVETSKAATWYAALAIAENRPDRAQACSRTLPRFSHRCRSYSQVKPMPPCSCRAVSYTH